MRGLDAVHEWVGHLDHGAGNDAERVDAPHELFEERLDLQSRQRGAEAEVGAEPEGDVVVAGSSKCAGSRLAEEYISTTWFPAGIVVPWRS